MSRRSQIEQLADMLGRIVRIGGTLVNRQCKRLPVSGLIAFVQAFGFDFHKFYRILSKMK